MDQPNEKPKPILYGYALDGDFHLARHKSLAEALQAANTFIDFILPERPVYVFEIYRSDRVREENFGPGFFATVVSLERREMILFGSKFPEMYAPEYLLRATHKFTPVPCHVEEERF